MRVTQILLMWLTEKSSFSNIFCFPHKLTILKIYAYALPYYVRLCKSSLYNWVCPMADLDFGIGGSISGNTKYSPVLHKVLPLWTLLWVPLCELQGRCMRSEAFTYYIHIHQSKRVALYLHADSLYRSLVLITLVTTVLCSTIPYRHFSPLRKLPNCHNVITD